MVEKLKGGTFILTKPIVWKEKERLNGDIVECTTVILKTAGCYWNSCYMCSYAREAYPATDEELKEQIRYVLSEPTSVLKIFTSGSFFDDREVSREVRLFLKDMIKKVGTKKLIVESRPEFITEDALEDFREVNLEVGIGLETADDKIRELCINKGFMFSDFVRAAKTLKEFGFRVKAYLLLKPLFLSEYEAIEDVVSSAEKIKDLVDVISINLTNVQKGTLVERLWAAGLYRPPWLWSAVECLRRISDIEVISDPVAAGKRRGPHNCGRCDREVASALRKYSLTQNRKYLLNLDCKCRDVWEKILELENFARIPLIK